MHRTYDRFRNVRFLDVNSCVQPLTFVIHHYGRVSAQDARHGRSPGGVALGDCPKLFREYMHSPATSASSEFLAVHDRRRPQAT